MVKKLNVALIQTNLVWENSIENKKQFQKKIEAISKPIDLIILPEMFTTGFTMNAANFAESMQGETVLWMQKLAENKNVAITGSVIIKENNNFYNRLLFVYPSGNVISYDKRHTFTLAGEDKVFSSGKNKVLIEYKGWKICPLICYDLRFPVWARNTESYDMLLYVANWPKSRIKAWSILLKARAIENMCYTIGVNRVGIDANNFEYTGHSAAYDCLGNTLCKSKNEERILLVSLDKKEQEKTRSKLNFLSDMDTFSVKK